MSESIIVTLSDTGEQMTLEYDSPYDLILRYQDHILGANEMEGRTETTYWSDPAKREEYRLECLRLKNG